MNSIKEKEMNRTRFLKKLYEKTGGHRFSWVSMFDIGKELEFDRSTTSDIVDYLIGAGVIKAVGLGGEISITHYGVVLIEEQISSEEKYEDIIFNIFRKRQNRTIEKMGRISPKAIAKFNSIYDNLGKGETENLSLLALSCRRMLKDLADVVYPARGEKVNGRDVTSAKFINRLWAFLDEKSKSGSDKQLSQALVQHLGGILDALHDYMNKGVHAEIVKEEAEKLLIFFYLFVSDILDLI